MRDTADVPRCILATHRCAAHLRSYKSNLVRALPLPLARHATSVLTTGHHSVVTVDTIVVDLDRVAAVDIGVAVEGVDLEGGGIGIEEVSVFGAAAGVVGRLYAVRGAMCISSENNASDLVCIFIPR